MFNIEQSWNMSESQKILAIIKEIEVWRLGNFDGCTCCRFSLRNVDIEISCGKGGERGIRISSKSLDYYDIETNQGTEETELKVVGEEIRRQVEASDNRGPIHIFWGNAHPRHKP